MLDLTQPATLVARELIGYELLVSDERGTRSGFIVETEAYTADDPASHSFRGPTKRNAAMFMPAGTVYVYSIYGLHYCLNIVCGHSDGQAVLIRALHPKQNIASMKKWRKVDDVARLCSGPANVFVALGLSPDINQKDLAAAGIKLIPPPVPLKVISGPRIGIRKAVGHPWRFRAV